MPFEPVELFADKEHTVGGKKKIHKSSSQNENFDNTV